MKGRVQIRLTPLQPRIPVEKLFIIECQPYPTDWPCKIAIAKIGAGAAVMKDSKKKKSVTT
jgi:hypothetical protein